MKLLITGANGLLGQKLVQLALQHSHVEVIATGRGESRLPEYTKGYTYHTMDIADATSVNSAVAKYQPDVLVNTAAMTNVDQCEQDHEGCWQANVESVKHLIAACEAHGVFLLHVSTDFIFDGSEGPLDEEAVPNPVNYYGESKLEAERLVQQCNTNWAIARTVLVYGIAHNMSRSNIILWVKDSLEKGKHIKVVNDQWRTPTLAEDLAQGCFLIGDQRATGIFNISGKDFLTPYDMAVLTAEFFDLDQQYMEKTDSTIFKQPAKRPPKTGFVIDKAVNQLGYKPHSFKEGLKVLAGQIGYQLG
ncbi:MAG: SDR family oxidoreductase [Bacteroidota bacterium]